MNLKYLLPIVLATVSIGSTFLAGAAQASIFTFSSRDSFNQALDADLKLIKRVEGWDTFAPRTIFPNGSTVNGITYNVSDGEAVVVSTGISLSPPNNLFVTTARSGFSPLLDTFTFGFHQPINAFGITFSSTFATTPGAYLATNNLGDVASSSFDPLFPGFPLGEFVGFKSDRPFTSVTISSTVNALYGMDDLIFARPSTEPISEPHSILGIFISGGAMWHMRKKLNTPTKVIKIVS